jgi:hypothetical protein
MIIKFREFILESNSNKIFYCDDSRLIYTSDKIRAGYLIDGLNKKISVDNYSKICMTIDLEEDLTMVINLGDTVVYYEKYATSCWEALFQKPEYKGLTKKEALDKFMSERFPIIADCCEMKITNWTFKNQILRVELIKN